MHDADFSHFSRVSRAKHMSSRFFESALQQPGSCVVVGVSVVVISHSLKSYVSTNSQPCFSHFSWSLSLRRHLSFDL